MANKTMHHLVIEDNNYEIFDQKARQMVASEYDATATYHIGDLVVYDGKLLRCTAEIATPEAYNLNHWTYFTVKDALDNMEQGNVLASCDTAENDLNKTVVIYNYGRTNYAPKWFGIVAIRFVNAVKANSTLNINNTGAKAIYKGTSPITDGVIKAGDTALFMLNGSGRYVFLGTDTYGEKIDSLTADVSDLKDGILDITKMGLSVIEQTVSQDIISHRTGRVWERKVWKYSVNQTADCPALDDYNEGVAVPFTDTVIGSDPYMDKYRVFRWMHCNYYREADGTARLITIEGYSDYAETGAVDIGTLLPTFWWAWDEYDDYWVLKFSDSPGEGLTPWKDAVRADGTVLPYFIVSAYPSVIASDGKLRSQKGKPANNQSYNNIITNYQKKGEGYWGAGSSINTLAYIYLIVKYQTKLEQNKFATNCGFSISAPVAKAESGVKRVLVASTETRFAKGDGVTVGTANNAYWLNGSLVPWAEVTSVEDVTVDGTAYKAIYLDVDSTFTTTTEMYVVGSACPSGQTDGVIGHYDGSIVSNTDSKHSIRIEGIELMNGLWFVLSDTVISFLSNYWQIYVAQKGTPHTANAHTGYKLIGESDAFTSDSYVGNVSFDMETGAMYHTEKGNSNANGNGAYHWNGGTEVADGTLREWPGWGYLYLGRPHCGLVAGYGWYALSNASANVGSRD